jgi:hypothetical protein
MIENNEITEWNYSDIKKPELSELVKYSSIPTCIREEIYKTDIAGITKNKYIQVYETLPYEDIIPLCTLVTVIKTKTKVQAWRTIKKVDYQIEETTRKMHLLKIKCRKACPNDTTLRVYYRVGYIYHPK